MLASHHISHNRALSARQGDLYRVGEFRESRDIGTMWPVYLVYGKCNCGQEDMQNLVAFFEDPEDAKKYVEEKNRLLVERSQARARGGSR